MSKPVFDMGAVVRLADRLHGKCTKLLRPKWLLALLCWERPLVTLPVVITIQLLARNPVYLLVGTGTLACTGLAGEYLRFKANAAYTHEPTPAPDGLAGDTDSVAASLMLYRNWMRSLLETGATLDNVLDELAGLIRWRDPRLTSTFLLFCVLLTLAPLVIEIRFLVAALLLFPFVYFLSPFQRLLQQMHPVEPTLSLTPLDSVEETAPRPSLSASSSTRSTISAAAAATAKSSSNISTTRSLASPNVEVSSDELSSRRERADTDALSLGSSLTRQVDQHQTCHECDQTFNFLRRKHYCRSCGNDFCGKCCSKEVVRAFLGATAPEAFEQTVRVCNSCFDELTTKSF